MVTGIFVQATYKVMVSGHYLLVSVTPQTLDTQWYLQQPQQPVTVQAGIDKPLPLNEDVPSKLENHLAVLPSVPTLEAPEKKKRKKGD